MASVWRGRFSLSPSLTMKKQYRRANDRNWAMTSRVCWGGTTGRNESTEPDLHISDIGKLLGPETAIRVALAKLLGQVTRPWMKPSAHSSSVSATLFCPR